MENKMSKKKTIKPILTPEQERKKREKESLEWLDKVIKNGKIVEP